MAEKSYCKECSSSLDLNAVGDRKSVDWDKKGEMGIFKAAGKTWLNILQHPKQFFSGMPVSGGIKSPLLFGLIWGSIAVMVSGIVNLILQLSGAVAPPPGIEAPAQGAMVGAYLILIVFAPLLVAIGLFVGSGVYHLGVMLFGGRKGFEATFRVICYTNAIAVFNLIPVLGAIFVTVYSVVLFCLGFKKAHGMTTAKAVLAALLPMIVLFGLGFIVAMTAALTGGTAPIAP